MVVVLVDDLGWADLACQGSRLYRTPHIDRLASEGVRFTQGYAACAVCSPTRAAIQTGRAPARTGVTDWIRARFQRGAVGTPASNPVDYVGGPDRALLCPPNPYWLAHDEVTIAELLKARGYATCHIGKWHLGDDAWYPEQQGYDENYGGCDYGQPPSYFDPFTNGRLQQGIPGLPGRLEGEFLTDREADEAVGFLRRNRDRRFFLHYAPYAVHTPIQAKPEVAARYQERITRGMKQRDAKYAAMVESVDDAVGRILATLDELQLTDRTLVVFTSDNGGLLGPTHNAPLRSGKGYEYEGGIRVPWIVRWPSHAPAGKVSEQVVTSVDLLPTVLAATGTERPSGVALDGESMLPWLASDAEIAARTLCWHLPHYRGADVTPYSVIRHGDWKLIRRDEGGRELYHLGDDPAERRDLAVERPEVVADLESRLDAWLTDAGAKRPRPNPGHRALPRVLLLGDSISIGYTPFVVEALKDEAEVVRPAWRGAGGGPENCAGTDHGLENLERWLAIGGGNWDVIHFNFGLHDLKRVDPVTGRNSDDPADPRQTEPEDYERQLRAIVERLQATGAKLVFATTTPVPEGGVRPHRDVEDPARYNTIARRLMAESGVRVDDLFAVVAARQTELLPKVDVHLPRAGYAALGGAVAEAVRAVLRAD